MTSKTLSMYGKPLSDPDFDVESELPALADVISKEALRKLKGKERKKQEYINGAMMVLHGSVIWVFQSCISNQLPFCDVRSCMYNQLSKIKFHVSYSIC